MVKECYKFIKNKRKRIISTLMSNYSGSSEESGRFCLKNNNATFSGRLNSVFEGLNALEVQHEEWKKTQNSSSFSSVKPDPEFDEIDASSERLFKKPGKVPKRRFPINSVPGFKKQPHKWIKYSLAEVSPHDMSEKANKRAAMAFLKQVEEKRFAPIQEIDSCTSDEGKPVFRKPSAKNVAQDAEKSPVIINSNMFQPRKIIMPEYNFGSKKKTRPEKLKAKMIANEVENRVNLCHLNYEEEVTEAEDLYSSTNDN